MKRGPALAFVFLLVFCATVGAQTPTAGPNINMVSGTTLPGGDPYLQRQNEPSMAMSSRNPRHMLAGANDYRSINIPFPDPPPGALAGGADAWLGVFKSFDGGATWQSTLLPGYPQQCASDPSASPLCAYGTAADPTVRAGTHGLFYYSGIATSRGTNQGAVFVSTFIDSNNKENGDVVSGTDPIPYLGTTVIDTGTSGQFIDKPWIAVDVPRAGAASCSIAGQSIPAGNVYIVWSRFTGANSTKIMLSRSSDCGKSWSTPTKLSESNSVNQGTVIAIDPLSGALNVAWRRFATSSDTNAIIFTRSTDFGKTFSKTTVISDIVPFDQQTGPGSFRTSSLPSIAVSAVGDTTRTHVAWSARTATNPDARVYVATLGSGAKWTVQPVDEGPIEDDAGHQFSFGHQLMPAITFGAGKLMVLYYDQRLDHAFGVLSPSGLAAGRLFDESYTQAGDGLDAAPVDTSKVFAQTIDDMLLTEIRHFIEVRAAQADVAAIQGSTLTFGPSEKVSRSRYGILIDGDNPDDPDAVVGTPDKLQQLDFNPPGLSIFSSGEAAFIGDYIDLAGETFLPPDGSGNGWRFNTASASAPVFCAAWTSNQDVMAPPDEAWASYDPTKPETNPWSQYVSPTQCIPKQEWKSGIRNQNIYMSCLTQGLRAGAPQNAKPLKAPCATSATNCSDPERAFVITVENTTDSDRTFRLAVRSRSQPAGGWASFVPSDFNDRWESAACTGQTKTVGGVPGCSTLDIQVGAGSGIARSLFVTSTDPKATIVVDVTEPAGALSSFVVLNADGTVPTLVDPDGWGGQSVSVIEIYNPLISDQVIDNPNAGVTAASTTNINVRNANVRNANVRNINVRNANVRNANVRNINVRNANVRNINVRNANVRNANVRNVTVADENLGSAVSASSGSGSGGNTVVTDASYLVSNDGNTTHSYHVKIVAPPGSDTDADLTQANLQLIFTKVQTSATMFDCALDATTGRYGARYIEVPYNTTLASIPNPGVTPFSSVIDPNIPDGRTNNATFSLGPGESAIITIRGEVDEATMQRIASKIAPAVVAHGSNGTFAAPLVVTSGSSTPFQLVVGTPFSITLEAFGGSAPYTWGVALGSTLPSWMTLSGASLTGTPTTAGVTSVDVQVTDGNGDTATKTLEFEVAKSATKTAVTPTPATARVGESVMLAAAITASSGTPTGTVSFSADGTVISGCSSVLLGGTCSWVPLSAGTYSLGATYSGDGSFNASSGTASAVVEPAATTTAFTPPVGAKVGQSATVSAFVTVTSPGTGTPSGTVTFSSGGSPVCTGTLSGGSASCAWTPSAAGSFALAAAYGGDTNFQASASGDASVTVGARATTTSLSIPAASVGQAVQATVTVTDSDAGAKSVPAGTVSLSGGATGTCALASATCTIPITPTAAGSFSVTATYSAATGPQVHSDSTGSSSLNVSPAATTVTLMAPDTVTAGTTVSLQVQVASTGGIPTGTVSISDGVTAISTCQTLTLISGGVSCDWTPASSASVSLVASYSGDANFSGSGSSTVSVTPTTRSTSTAVVLSSSLTVGQTAQVTVTVSDTTAGTVSAPQGTITLSGGAAGNCTLGSLTSSTASCTLAITPGAAGTLNVTATYQPASSPQVHTSSSGTASGSAAARSTTTAIVIPTAVYGQGSVQATVTVSDGDAGTRSVPQGTVALSGVSGTCTGLSGSGSSATSTCTITVAAADSFPVTATYQPATAPQLHASSAGGGTLSVNLASSATVLTAPATATAGTATALSVKVTATPSTAGTPTGTITISAGGTAISTCQGLTLVAGSASCSWTPTTTGVVSLVAAYSGAANFATSVSTPSSVTVGVPPYTFIGFITPLATAGPLTSPSNSGSWTMGRALPIKWQLKDPLTGAFLTDIATTTKLVARNAKTGSEYVLYLPTSGASGNSTFRYDLTNNQFVFNWDTTNATAASYTLALYLSDGSSAKATNITLKVK